MARTCEAPAASCLTFTLHHVKKATKSVHMLTTTVISDKALRLHQMRGATEGLRKPTSRASRGSRVRLIVEAKYFGDMHGLID